ncbi:Fibulin-2 [Nymphon striatum]|nr:Fibulin-2 [Nymphon striatum]
MALCIRKIFKMYIKLHSGQKYKLYYEMSEYENMLERCCKIGSDWSNTHNTCNGYNAPVSGIPVEHQAICLSTVSICCVRLSRIRSCATGRETARLGQDCSHLPQITGGEAHKDCCKSCKLGLIASSMTFPCTLTSFRFGHPWDDSYLDCCKSPKGTITDPHTSDGDVCGDSNPCEHTCIKTGDEHFFLCRCYSGFRLKDDLRSCQDINECAEGVHNCTNDKPDCINVLGGYQCYPRDIPTQSQNCPNGFRRNPQTFVCEDVDECVENTHNCDLRSSVCVNSIGNFDCQQKINPKRKCQFGFDYSDVRKTCIDTDECFKRIDACNRKTEICVNTVGGYICEMKDARRCESGFKTNLESKICEDIDECETVKPCKFSHFCLNTQGRYECYDISVSGCPAGFKTNEARTTCIDVDECTENLHSCGASKICINERGRYKCETAPPCKAGFKRDHISAECIDVDECKENLASCNSVNEICVNLNASYTCKAISSGNVSRIQCPSGYKFNQNTYDCQDIDECEDGTNDCYYDTDVCVNVPGHYECRQQVGQQKLCSEGMNLNLANGLCEDIDECATNNGRCNTTTETCVNTIGSFKCQIQSPVCPSAQVYSSALNRCIYDQNSIFENISGQYVVLGLGDIIIIIIIINGWVMSDPPLHPSQKLSKAVLSGVVLATQVILACPIFLMLSENLVFYPVTFVSKPTDKSIREGDTARFECLVSGVPTPSIKWFKDGLKNFIAVEERRALFGNGNKRLIILNSKKTDAGIYSCEAGNGAESIIANATLSILDECVLGTHRCDLRTEVCFPTEVGYECRLKEEDSHRCSYGMELVGSQCVDINECQLGIHNCPSSERCDNTVGSFSCSRILDCGTGYTWNTFNHRCEDNDECVLSTHHCGKGFKCVNTKGSFRCEHTECPKGYRKSSDGMCEFMNCRSGYVADHNGNCIDNDECLGNPCQNHEVCINSIGSYSCRSRLICGNGYRPNEYGTQCTENDYLEVIPYHYEPVLQAGTGE